MDNRQMMEDISDWIEMKPEQHSFEVMNQDFDSAHHSPRRGSNPFGSSLFMMDALPCDNEDLQMSPILRSAAKRVYLGINSRGKNKTPC